jgi:hypothetical protein
MGCRINYCPFKRGEHCLKCEHYIKPFTEYSEILEKALLKVKMLNVIIIAAHPKDLQKIDMDTIEENVYFVEMPFLEKGQFVSLLGDMKEQAWKYIQSGIVTYKQGRKEILK